MFLIFAVPGVSFIFVKVLLESEMKCKFKSVSFCPFDVQMGLELCML